MNKIVFKFLVANSGYIIDKSTIKEILDNVDERKKFSIKDYFKLINEIKGYSKTRIILMQILRLLWNILIIATAVFSLYTIGNIIYQVIKTNDVTFFVSTYTALVTLISILLLVALVKTFITGIDSIKSHIVTLLIVIGLLFLQLYIPTYQGTTMQSNYVDNATNSFDLWDKDIYKPVMIHGTQKLTIHFDDGAFGDGMHFSSSVIKPTELETPVNNLSELYRVEQTFKNINDQLKFMWVNNEYTYESENNPISSDYYSLSIDEFNQTNNPTLENTTDIGINRDRTASYSNHLYIYTFPNNQNSLIDPEETYDPAVTIVKCDIKIKETGMGDPMCVTLLSHEDINDIIVLLKKE